MEKICQELLTKPIPKIIAVGKNYALHVKEMGGTAAPKDPVIFTKPFTALVPPSSKQINLFHNRDVNHEVELGFVMKKQAQNVKNIDISEYIGSYFVALDLTDRPLQTHFKKQGFPWDLAKGFDNSLPVSELVPFEKVKDVNNLELHLNINGKTVQNDFTSNMIYKIPYLIEFVSQYMTLNPGDMFITGTPSGVGPIKNNDKLEALLKQDGEILASIEKTVNQVQSKL